MAAIALLGSGEFLPWSQPVDEWCARASTASSDRALVVPTASAPEGEEVFQRWAQMGSDHYRSIGLEPVVLELRDRADAESEEIVDAVADARVVFFSGGNPGYLAETVRGTAFWAAVLDAVARGTAIGGCSAGAVFLGALAPYVADMAFSHWVPGLALLPKAYVIAHFDALESFAVGLRRFAIESRPDGCTTAGIDEDTALYGDGENWTVAGAGAVWIGDDPTDPARLEPRREGDAVPVRLGLALP